jgi:hypothetical protein
VKKTIRIGLLSSAVLSIAGFTLGANDISIGERLFDLGFTLTVLFVILGFFSSVRSYFK